MRTITLKLAAGTRDEITAPGNFLHLVESSAAVDIELDNGMRLQDMLAGTWAEPGEFSRIAFYSDTAQTIKILVARGRAGVFRVSGEVSVISGEVARSKANVAFWGGRVGAAEAAKYSHVQLWNPAGSGVNAVIEEILCWNATAATGQCVVRESNAAISTLFQAGKSKLMGGAASVVEVRHENNALVLGTGTATSVACPQQTVPLSMKEPLILPPGYGAIIQGGAVNESMRAAFQWFEEPI